MYLIKWEGFGDEENTWIPESDLYCPDILEEFERNYKAKAAAKKAPKKQRKRRTRKTKSVVDVDNDSDQDYECTFDEVTERRSSRNKKLSTQNLREISDEEIDNLAVSEEFSQEGEEEESNGWTCTACRLYDDSNDRLECFNCSDEYHRLCVLTESESESLSKAEIKKWKCPKCVGNIFYKITFFTLL